VAQPHLLEKLARPPRPLATPDEAHPRDPDLPEPRTPPHQVVPPETEAARRRPNSRGVLAASAGQHDLAAAQGEGVRGTQASRQDLPPEQIPDQQALPPAANDEFLRGATGARPN